MEVCRGFFRTQFSSSGSAAAAALLLMMVTTEIKR